MNSSENIHDWFNAQVATALAGGLTPEDRQRFDAHLAECASCQALLAEIKTADQLLNDALADLQPPADLEERIIRGLPKSMGLRRFIGPEHPMIQRAAAMVAAAIIVGAAGYGGLHYSNFLSDKSKPVAAGNAMPVSPPAIASAEAATRPSLPPFNFQNAPLASVLTYMSDTYGYDIKAQVPITGRVQMLQSQMLANTPQNALDLFESALQANGYAANVNGKTITVTGAPAIKKEGIPVYYGTDTASIPESEEMRTQVMQVKTADVSRLRSELTPLLDKDTDLTVNPGSNSIMVTDTASHVKAIAGIIDSLDSRESRKDVPVVSSGKGSDAGYAGPVVTQPLEFGPGEIKHLQMTPNAVASVAPGEQTRDLTPGATSVATELEREKATLENQALADANPSRGGGRGGGGGGGFGGGGRAGLALAPGVNSGSQQTTPGAPPAGSTSVDRSRQIASAGTAQPAVPPMQPDLAGRMDALQPMNRPPAPAAAAAKAGIQLASAQVDDAAKDAAATPAGPPSDAGAATKAAASDRKIIRNGQMEVEVENFDAAYSRLRDIVRESGGYIGSTDSQRLPNGKVRGVVSVRVAPENLDTLVLKLRALGDLKSQQVTAQDITKEYTDLESELRAAQAMQDRLLEIIRTGKGEVKDLLAVEKELGNWREKIEQTQGQINYYNNLVALSTLQITIAEKDIGQAAVATQNESVNAGLEADDVQKARDEFIKAVDAAKGRIVQADLRQQEAGQFTATIVAAVPPDAAGAVQDRLRQLGRVTRWESALRQSGADPTALPGVRVERRDAIINLSIFNVAAYSARTTDNLTMACDDVEGVYKQAIDFVNHADGGHVISSNLNRPQPNTAVGSLVFEVKESSADAALAFLRASGIPLQLNVTENPDAANVTNSKRAFNVTINPLASIAPQETDELTLMPAAGDLQAAYQSLLDYAAQPGSGVRVVDHDLQQQNGVFTSAGIAMEVTRQKLDDANRAIAAAGKIVTRKATRQPDSVNVVDTKVLLKFSFVNVDLLEPRQTITRTLAADAAPAAYQAILDAARKAGAKVRTAQLNVNPGSGASGLLEFDLPAEKLASLESVIAGESATISKSVVRSPETDATTDLKVRLSMNIVSYDSLSPRRTYQLEIQTANPEQAALAVPALMQVQGLPAPHETFKVMERSSDTDSNGVTTVKVVLVGPLSEADAQASAARGQGSVLRDTSSQSDEAPAGDVARARLEIQFKSEPSILSGENGLWATIRQGLTTSIRALLAGVYILVIGVLLVAPCALVGWGVRRWMRRRRSAQ